MREFLVDANVILYAAMPGPEQVPCLEIIDAVARGQAAGRTSTAVLEEVWHVELSGRAGDLDGLTLAALDVFTPLLPVTESAFRSALQLGASQVGANDRLHVGTCLENGLDLIVSADRGLDRIPGVQRVDPLDEVARRRLLDSP